MSFIDGLDNAVSSRNRRGDSCFLIDEAEFAKDAIVENCFEMQSINDYIDFSFLVGDNQHELGLIDRKYSPAGSATGPGGVVV